jgi:MFS family permease
VCNLVGIVCGGVAADLLARSDVRWRTRVGLISALAASTFLLVTMLAPSRSVMVAGFAGWCFACGLFVGPTYGLFQSLVRPNMRATITAVQNVVGYAIGGSLGPLLVGFVSDALAATQGHDSLRHALLWMAPFYVWGSVHYARAGRTVAADLGKAREPLESSTALIAIRARA